MTIKIVFLRPLGLRLNETPPKRNTPKETPKCPPEMRPPRYLGGGRTDTDGRTERERDGAEMGAIRG